MLCVVTCEIFKIRHHFGNYKIMSMHFISIENDITKSH